jgi:multidrug efflux pump subunit AcrB
MFKFNLKQVLEKKNSQSYLDKLEFNLKLKKGFLAYFIQNIRVVILIIVFLFAFGIYSFLSLPRESSPEVKIPIAIVSAVYPGASPLDVEELVVKKLENRIANIEGVNKISSRSSNSQGSITVEFDAKEDLDDAIRKLRDEVSNVSSELPSEVNEPMVFEISFDNLPILNIALFGQFNSLELREIVDDLVDDLDSVKGISDLIVSGGDITELEIAYNPDLLLFYNLNLDQIHQKIRASNITAPLGNFEGEEFNYPLRLDNRFTSIDDLANTPVAHTQSGAIIYLKDIAKVSEIIVEKNVYSRISSNKQIPQEAVNLQVVKKTGASIIEVVDQVLINVDTYVDQYDGLLTYEIVDNSAQQIDDDFKQLTKDFSLTFILVFLVLFLVIGFKEAIVAGIAIPLTFFASFIVMNSLGISLNFLSVFSLILALGLLVDDAIVVVSATKQYLRSGKFTPEEAVLLVLNDFKVVLLTTTLTTIWAFLPLLMATGIIGEFIKSIPITVSVTFISSFIIALIINHPLAAVLERFKFSKKVYSFTLFFSLIFSLAFFFYQLYIPATFFIITSLSLIIWYFKAGKEIVNRNSRLIIAEKRDDDLIRKKLRDKEECSRNSFLSCLMNGLVSLDKILPIYEKYLRKIIFSSKKRLVVIISVLILFISALALPALGIIENEFFPDTDSNNIFINIEAPVGLKLEESSKIVAQVEQRLLDYSEIISFSTVVGRPVSMDFGNSSASHLSSIVINLVDERKRDLASYQLADLLREEFKNFSIAKVEVEAPRGGPPVSAPVEARISGPDLQELERISKDLERILGEIEGVVGENISLKESPAEYTFNLDSNKLQLYNLNSTYISSILRLAISGVEVTNILKDGEESKVIARFDKNKIPTLASIQNLEILNLSGQKVFLKDVAKVELKPSVEAIERIDQVRTVILSANVKSGINPVNLVNQFNEEIKGYPFPEDYSISFGGESEQNEESVRSILVAMILAGLLIVSTLVIQFNSFKQSIIVLVTIPLALIGVFYGIALIGVNLSFPGLIGILALFGIVVKNAIILIDKINLNIKNDIPFYESIIDAGKSRLEAIIITSLCTILGILPITLSDELWRALGSAVIFGLMLSAFLTLFIVPILYASWIKDEQKEQS